MIGLIDIRHDLNSDIFSIKRIKIHSGFLFITMRTFDSLNIYDVITSSGEGWLEPIIFWKFGEDVINF
jgi:hypothetical protein